MATNKVREFLEENMTDKDCLDVIASYMKFEEQGYIGDEPCRTWTEKYLEGFDLSDANPNIIRFMGDMYSESLRRFAVKKLKEVVSEDPEYMEIINENRDDPGYQALLEELGRDKGDNDTLAMN